MRFTLNLGFGDYQQLLQLAQAAEQAGFNHIGIPDSLFYPEHSDSKYPYTETGARNFLEDVPLMDPVVAIASMAAVTKTLRFYPSVYKLPVRHPLAVAKQFSSLAAMSGNRVSIGVGLSPWEEDFTYLGLDWASRGKRIDECIEVFRGVLQGGYFSYQGEFYEFGNVKMAPIPSEPIPILIGGHSNPALRRAVRAGDGWVSANSSYDALKEIIAKLQAYRVEFEVADKPFQIHAFDTGLQDAAGVERLAELGVTDTVTIPWNVFEPPQTLEEKLEAIQRFGDQVIARSR